MPIFRRDSHACKSALQCSREVSESRRLQVQNEWPVVGRFDTRLPAARRRSVLCLAGPGFEARRPGCDSFRKPCGMGSCGLRHDVRRRDHCAHLSDTLAQPNRGPAKGFRGCCGFRLDASTAREAQGCAGGLIGPLHYSVRFRNFSTRFDQVGRLVRDGTPVRIRLSRRVSAECAGSAGGRYGHDHLYLRYHWCSQRCHADASKSRLEYSRHNRSPAPHPQGHRPFILAAVARFSAARGLRFFSRRRHYCLCRKPGRRCRQHDGPASHNLCRSAAILRKGLRPYSVRSGARTCRPPGDLRKGNQRRKGVRADRAAVAGASGGGHGGLSKDPRADGWMPSLLHFRRCASGKRSRRVLPRHWSADLRRVWIDGNFAGHHAQRAGRHTPGFGGPRSEQC